MRYVNDIGHIAEHGIYWNYFDKGKGSCVKMPASILHLPSSAHCFVHMTAAGEQIDQAGVVLERRRDAIVPPHHVKHPAAFVDERPTPARQQDAPGWAGTIVSS
jgi:hypothetical protein